jgi:hypothetical protein
MRNVSYAMTKAKRHHWWPMAQSVYWTNSDGFVSVTRSDGTVFPANPLNIGVESELYTRFSEERGKDTGIEEWFAQTIDGPAKQMIEHLLDPSKVHRSLSHLIHRKQKWLKRSDAASTATSTKSICRQKSGRPSLAISPRYSFVTQPTWES